MNTKKDLGKILYCLLVFGLFLGLMYLAGRKLIEPEWQQENDEYEMVFFGDSLLGGLIRDDTSVTEKTSRMAGKKIFNATFGGTGLAYSAQDGRIAYTKESYNLTGLILSMKAGDFRVQDYARVTEGATEYYAFTIHQLADIDFTKIDTVFFEHAVNDYHAGVLLDNLDDAYDVHSYAGAFRTCVKNIRQINPDIRIIVVTPIYTWYPEQGLNCENYVINGNTLADFVDCQWMLCQELDLELIDLYQDLDVFAKEDTWGAYSVDGLHPNEEGRELIARRIADYLMENL